MPDYAVSTAFLGKDKVSHLFDKMGRSANRFGNDGKKAFRGVRYEADHASTALRNASKHGYKFGAIVKGILAANAIRGGIGYVTGGLAKVGSDFLQFGDTMTGAVARFDEVDVKSAAFGTTIESMGKRVRNAMVGTRHSALDGAQGLNELAKAGYDSGKALGILPNLAAFATASQEKLGEATTMSSDILGAFGLRNENVNIQLRNHARLNDQLTKSALLATGDMRDMFETLKTAAPITKEMGVAQETVLALGVALSNAGIKGDVAATAMKRAMTSLYASSMQAELEANGVFAFDKMGNPRKITAVLGDLGKALDKLTPQQRIPIIKDIFGMYGLAGSIKMMRELKAVAKYEEKILGADGLSQTMADAANTSPLAKLIMLGNTAMEKGFQVLDQYSASGKKGVEWLTEKIRNFDMKPLIRMLNVTGKAVYGVYKVVEPFIPMLPYIVGGFLAWRAALVGLASVKFLAAVTEMAWGVALMEGALAGGGLAAGFWAIAAPLAVIGANLLIWREVAKSLNGKDNLISQGAQWLGLVPKLAQDADGNVTGRSSNQYGWTPWDNGDQVDAPNKTDAAARAQGSWKGYLQFGNMPEGSTINGKPAKSAWEFGAMGVNP